MYKEGADQLRLLFFLGNCPQYLAFGNGNKQPMGNLAVEGIKDIPQKE